MTDNQTIAERQDPQKQIIIDSLKKTPIIQAVCEKAGISRATFYRWLKDSEEFAQAVEESIATGKGLVNDAAESKLIQAISDGNLTAIFFWLRAHKRDIYGNKLELTANTPKEELDDEQKELVAKAMEMGGLLEPPTAPEINNEETYDNK